MAVSFAAPEYGLAVGQLALYDLCELSRVFGEDDTVFFLRWLELLRGWAGEHFVQCEARNVLWLGTVPGSESLGAAHTREHYNLDCHFHVHGSDAGTRLTVLVVFQARRGVARRDAGRLGAARRGASWRPGAVQGLGRGCLVSSSCYQVW